jgi:hypothetical protein
VEAFRWFGFAAGLALVIVTVGSVMRVLIVPRALSSRLSRRVYRMTRGLFLAVVHRFETYEAKDRVLALQAPMFLLALLLSWLLLFFIGYSLMLWPLVDDIGGALREAGSSMVTLGFAATESPGTTALHFIAGITGLIVIALQIAYLPTLYGSFNRRETLVTMLQSRAGTPAWGPEILRRHRQVDTMDRLPDLYAEWERWAADVAETHTTYPVLIFFRSPHPLRSWVLALLAVMDSAALYLALCPASAPTETRLCLRMGFTCLREIARLLRIEYDADPFPDDPIELSYDDFLEGIARLTEVDFPTQRSPEEAWAHFKGWRVNYEAVAYRLADAVIAPPGPWSGPRTDLPGIEIAPSAPANRTPDDPKLERPRGAGMGT